ncbi:GntR family transcriptional regulator / MocR family aminotransferase [Dyella sp. OK004]|uniref:MocR-like pyridoxine biosynthesis transcription factor PdxR n=1 Tax=Dyella sp. OK004 TaxID=1855292 RepID=UPI0008E3C65D|nr:PLP-dependent aminotransferase family protein [Dyella sp. OK004]SFR95012.1 GntR family transcriptional regulator / MocR family aminotransferase [Dyella sp. OK004]
MFLELDGQGPRYAQLTRALKAAILDGRLGAGTRLPPTRALARDLEMSRITALAAYEQLRAEGFIEGHVGSGSYVAAIETKPAPPPSERTIAAPSRYARRARAVADRTIGVRHHGLRYNLQYGNPQTHPALNDLWARELARAAAYTPQGGSRAQGLLSLREQVCDYLARRRGVQTRPEDVLIISGTQQAFTLTARVLLDEGDRVVMEDPTYFGARQAFGAHGAKLVPVRTDADGLVCSALPRNAPRLIYVTPSHQFPSGTVLSLQRRLELLRYAAEHRCWVIEDDYDSEFRYDSHPLHAMRSLDHSDRVIYVGTFSKVMFGSLRLAYMVVPAALRDDFVTAKYLSDFFCPVIEQAALAHFMESGGFERHLRHATKELKSRRDALIEGLHRHAGDRVEIANSQAGMHMVAWLRGYDYARAEALIDYAHEHGLGLHPMEPHYFKRPAQPGLILGYCALSTVELREAMQLFGRCLDAFDQGVA